MRSARNEIKVLSDMYTTQLVVCTNQLISLSGVYLVFQDLQKQLEKGSVAMVIVTKQLKDVGDKVVLLEKTAECLGALKRRNVRNMA